MKQRGPKDEEKNTKLHLLPGTAEIHKEEAEDRRNQLGLFTYYDKLTKNERNTAHDMFSLSLFIQSSSRIHLPATRDSTLRVRATALRMRPAADSCTATGTHMYRYT